MAVAEGFEPSDGGYPSHAFEACSLGRSDTPPCGTLPGDGPANPIAPSVHSGRCSGRKTAQHAHSTNLSLPREERLQRRRALLRQHPAPHLGPVGEPAVAHHVP